MRISRSNIITSQVLGTGAVLTAGFSTITDRQEGWALVALLVVFALYQVRHTFPTKVLWVYAVFLLLIVGWAALVTFVNSSLLRFALLMFFLLLDTFLRSAPDPSAILLPRTKGSKEANPKTSVFSGLSRPFPTRLRLR